MGSSEHLFWAPLCQHITVRSWAMWSAMSLHTMMEIAGHWTKYKAPGIRDAFSSGKNGCEILRVISIDVFVHFFIEYLHDLQAPKWFHPQPLRDSQGWTQKLMDQLKHHIHFPEVGAHCQHHMVLSLLNVLQSYSNLENLETQLRSCALFSAPLLTPHGHEEKEEQEHESFSRRPLPSPPLTAHHLRPSPHDYLNSPGLAAVYTSSTTQGTTTLHLCTPSGSG